MRQTSAQTRTREDAGDFRPTSVSLRIVALLAARGTLRFTQIKTTTFTSAKTLSANLRDLERNGLVQRRAYATIPPRVEYSLSEIGRDFAQLSAAWEAWLDRSRAKMTAARGGYDAAEGERRSSPAQG